MKLLTTIHMVHAPEVYALPPQEVFERACQQEFRGPRLETSVCYALLKTMANADFGPARPWLPDMSGLKGDARRRGVYLARMAYPFTMYAQNATAFGHWLRQFESETWEGQIFLLHCNEHDPWFSGAHDDGMGWNRRMGIKDGLDYGECLSKIRDVPYCHVEQKYLADWRGYDVVLGRKQGTDLRAWRKMVEEKRQSKV